MSMIRFLIVLLCLSLPLQGFAAWQAPASPCSMQDMMTLSDEAGDTADILAMEDCCNDMATFERTGQLCKSVQNCVAPAAGMPGFSSIGVQIPVTQDPKAPTWCNSPSAAISRLWRPPASS